MVEEILNDAESRMKKSIESLHDDLVTLRTGRASPALVEHLRVDSRKILAASLSLPTFRVSWSATSLR